MTHQIKACVDCKHYSQIGDGAATCISPRNPYEPITGKIIPLNPESSRGYYGRCKPIGELWESKTKKPWWQFWK